MLTIIAIIIGYLLGSLSSAIILSKLMHFPDPRTVGTGNAGATNVLRMVGKNEALMVVIGDVLKGLIAVWIGRLLGVHGAMLGIVALAAVVGHVFPLYFNFKGGKGVATALGALLGLSFIVGVLTFIVWAVFAYFFRYASFASLVAIVGSIIFTLIFATIYAFPVFLIAILIFWKHQENIMRLRSGTESKIQF